MASTTPRILSRFRTPTFFVDVASTHSSQDGRFGARVAWGMQRQALHAARLRLSHPVSGAELGFSSAVPADFRAALDAAGLRYNEGDL